MNPPSTAFRVIERVFRRGNGVLTEACALAKGALDFHANPPSNAVTFPPLAPTPKLACPPPLGTGCLMYGLSSHPGFYILPGAISPTHQLSLFRACLRYYIEPPQCQRSVVKGGGDGSVSLWQSSVRQGIGAPSPLHTLAWATLGVHFDWKARCYPTRGKEGGKVAQTFPPILGSVLQSLAESIEGRVSAARPSSERDLLSPFHPHSAIVSLYHPSRSKERLPIAGHKDDAPGEDLTTPVVSISLGATAVFLLGGETKECTPTPLLLHSGDVMVLSGHSRACVHGVARVLFPSTEGGEASVQEGPKGGEMDDIDNLPQLAGARGGGEGGDYEKEREMDEERRAYFPGGEEEERAFLHFLTQARINITARSIINTP